MTLVDKSRFRSPGFVLAIAPWPATAGLVGLLLGGWAVSLGGSFTASLSLVPKAVAGGQPWRVVTGLLVQPPDWALTLTAAVAAGLFGRELEERSGGWGTLRLVLIAGIATGVGWVAIQSLAKSLLLQSGWEAALVSYPAITAVVAYRTAQMPFARMSSTGYLLPTWACAAGYFLATFFLLTWHSWPILLPAHLLGLVLGAGWSYANQRSLDACVQRVHLAAEKRSSSCVVDESDRDLDDAELDRVLDRLLAKIAARGQDSLSARDRVVLADAARRMRDRRRT